MSSILLTPAAARQIRAQIAKQGSGIGLRVGLKPVGCSGYAYTFALADEVHDDEIRIESHDATLLIDKRNLPSLEGACLDYVTEGLKRSFQFDNPNVGNTCGCGESFSLKPGASKGAAS